MKFIKTAIDSSTAYLLPIGDIHIGDSAFTRQSRKLLNQNLEFVRQHDNARIFLLGDIFNCASRHSKTSPFTTNADEYQEAVDLFKPYASRIIGAVDGNHEARMFDDYGVSPLAFFCRELKIPYCQWSAVLRLMVGKRSTFGYREDYYCYLHHTTGGGGTLGSKLNRVVKLRDMVEGIDVYIGGHNHTLITAPQEVYYPTQHGVQKRTIWHVDAGSYLEHDGSYAEKGMLPPSRLGSPKLLFESNKHDIKPYLNL